MLLVIGMRWGLVVRLVERNLSLLGLSIGWTSKLVLFVGVHCEGVWLVLGTETLGLEC